MLNGILIMFAIGTAHAAFPPPQPSPSCNHVAPPEIVATIDCRPTFARGKRITVDIYEAVQCRFPQRFHVMYRNSSSNYTANGQALDGDFDSANAKEMLMLRTHRSNFGEDYLSLDRTLVTQPGSTGKMVEIFGVGEAGHAEYNCTRLN